MGSIKKEWSPYIAEKLAKQENIQLTQVHWFVIDSLREFYQEYNHIPTQRALINYLKTKSKEKNIINSIWLLKLFPNSPLQQAAKIAGLPKHGRCI